MSGLQLITRLKLPLLCAASALLAAAAVAAVYELGSTPGAAGASGTAQSGDQTFTALSEELRRQLQLEPAAGAPSAPVAAAVMGEIALKPTHPPIGDGDGLPSVEDMVARLESRLMREPGDFQGWMMLGWSRLRLNRPGEAVGAYRAALKLQPERVDALAGVGEALVSARNGEVTDEAAETLEKALAIDPSNPAARFFLADRKNQQGDAAGAIEDWLALLESAPEDAEWRGDVLARLRETAESAGVDLQGRLPAR